MSPSLLRDMVQMLRHSSWSSQIPRLRKRALVAAFAAQIERFENRALLSGTAIVGSSSIGSHFQNSAAQSVPASQSPVVTGFGGTLTYLHNGPELKFASHLVITDSESSTLNQATVSFTNWQSGDRMGFFDDGVLQFGFTENLTAHTAVLTFSGTASVAEYQSELRTLAFFNVAANPVTTTRVAHIQVNDGISSSSSVSEQIQFGHTLAISGLPAAQNYVPGGSPLSFASSLVISDGQSTTLKDASIAFTNWQTGDRLSFSNSAALQHSFSENLSNHTATLLLTGAATVSAYQTELRSLQFFNVTAAPVTTPRTVMIQVHDDVSASNSVSGNIQFAHAPVLSGFGGTLTYTAGDSPLKFATNITITQANSSVLSGATISVVNWETGDRLSFSNDAGLVVGFSENLTTHTARLTLTGSSTVAAYQQELRTLAFFNVNSNPSTATRVVTITVNNGSATSNSVSENIAVRSGPPAISISSPSMAEGDAGTKLLAFVVSLSKASTLPITVAYATSNLTATAGEDYVATSGILTVPAGQTSATINVQILSETQPEPDESFAVTLSNPTNAQIATATGTGTILNDDFQTSGTVLSDNTSNTSSGTRVADSTHWLAASFETGNTFTMLQSITLLMNQSTAGNVTVAIYTGSGQVPVTLFGTLTSPASFSSSLSRTTFTTNGFVLLPNTKFWVVLRPTSGTFHWSSTNGTMSSGTGYTGQWASSANAGSTWTLSLTSPLQMDVLEN